VTRREELLDAEAAARIARIDVTFVRRCAEIGLVTPSSEGYSEAEMAELRRARRLHDDLGLDYEAIEVVLEMVRRIRGLQAEIRRLQRTRASESATEREWMEGDYEERR
jgi:hypothetical protein